MIDVELAKKEFKNFINQLEINNLKVQRKIDHIYRVSEISKKIAIHLGLTEEQIKLAQLIGLLHDIGRFEEYKMSDKKVFDHGQAGVEILKSNNYIRKYIDIDQYDDIIFTAIDEHNEYKLSEALSEENKLFCEIIRDADKIDIIYEGIYIYWQTEEEIEKFENGKLSEKMLEDFYHRKIADKTNKISKTDEIVRFASFIFDMNFKCSLEMLKESDNLSKMIDRFHYQVPETREEIKKIKQFANDYIREKTK